MVQIILKMDTIILILMKCKSKNYIYQVNGRKYNI